MGGIKIILLYLAVYLVLLIFLVILYFLSKTEKTKASLKKFFLFCALAIGLWSGYLYYDNYAKQTLIAESVSPTKETTLKVIQLGRPTLLEGTRLRVVSPQNQVTHSFSYQKEPYFSSCDIVVTWENDEKATIDFFQKTSLQKDKTVPYRTLHYVKGKGVSY